MEPVWITFAPRFANVYLLANLGKYEILYENYSEGNDDINGTTITLAKPFDNKKYKFYQIITGQGKDIAKSLFFLAEDNIKTFTFQTIRWTEPGIAGLCGCEIISNNKITLKMITGTYSGDSIVKIIGFLK